MDLGLSGLASGFDWRSLIDQLADVERAPQRQLLAEQSAIGERNNAYGSMVTQLNVLRNRVTELKSTALYDSRTSSVADQTIAKSSVSAGAIQGSYLFSFSQLATAAKQIGQTGVGRALSATNDVSGLVLANAGFGSSVTAGTFTVNGARVSIETTDTLQAVFDKISTATGGGVTAAYSAATDKITLSSAAPIVLGSATDNSNFLQAAKLNNNGTGAITSAGELGSVRLSTPIASSNLATPLTDGGTGTGLFKVNGVEITFSSSDSVSNILTRINSSTAGVTASYDSVNDRFLLTNKETGDVGVSMQDVRGNFLAASGLSSGSLQRGKDLVYTIDGGGQMTSHSNTITGDASGLVGLSVTALKENQSTTVTITGDTAKVKGAIESFISDFNKVQSLIETQTASSTDNKGKVTVATLANESEASDIATQLRRIVYSQVSGIAGAFKHLESLGIATTGKDNNLKIQDASKLDSALTNDMAGVKDLLSNETYGIAKQLDKFLEKAVGDSGSLTAHQSTLSKQSAAIDTQIADLERIVQTNRERMISSFIAMEQAQAKSNQTLQFLSQRFGAG